MIHAAIVVCSWAAAFWILLLLVALLAACAQIAWRTRQQRKVQVWVGEDEGGGAERIVPAGKLIVPAPGKAQDGGAPSELPMDDDLREALKASLHELEPRHFRVLRWLGWECNITEGEGTTNESKGTDPRQPAHDPQWACYPTDIHRQPPGSPRGTPT